MGIIEDYLNSDDVKASPQAKSSGVSIIDQYMNEPDDSSKSPIRDLGNYPKPFTEAEKIEAAKPKVNPRDRVLTEGVKDLPFAVGKAIKDTAVSGAELAGQGITDYRAGNKLKGIGEVGLGGLITATSPISGTLKAAVEEPVTQITGNPDIGERASFVAGALVPAVPSAKVISKIAPKNSSFRTLVESIGEENIPNVIREMKSNPRLTPADLSPKVMQDTQHLFTVDGPHINKLAKATENRANTAKDAVLDIYDTSAGPSVNLVQKINDLAQASKNVGTKEINPALVNAGPVAISSSLQAIDKVLSPGVLKVGDSVPLTSVKKELQSIQKNLRASKEYNASDLHSFQSGLRRTAESLLRSADGSSKEVGRALMEVRNNLVNDIDKASGGKYKPALSKYRDEMHISDAFKEGYQGIFSSSKSMENTPSFTKKWFDNLTDAEKQAAREGARASIATEIGVAKNPALAGEALSRSDFNREKLRILFGDKEANELIRKLEHERKIADTNNKLVHGSQTAMRNASKEAFDLPKPSDPNRFLPPIVAEGVSLAATGAPLLGAGAYYGARGASKLKDIVKGKLQREHNARYVNLALPTNEPDRQALIRSLEDVVNRPVKQSLLRRGASALTKVIQP